MELKHKLEMKQSEVGMKEKSKEKILNQLAEKENKISKLSSKLKHCKSKDEAEEVLHKISL